MKLYFVKNLAISIALLMPAVVLAAPIFVDELEIAISHENYLKKFTTAKPVFQKSNPTRETLLLPYPKLSNFSGYSMLSIGRTFVSGFGCAAMAGFGPLSAGDVEKLVVRLKKKHSLIEQELPKSSDGRRLIYMTDSDAKIKISVSSTDGIDNKFNVGYDVVLNTCPAIIAHEYQVNSKK